MLDNYYNRTRKSYKNDGAYTLATTLEVKPINYTSLYIYPSEEYLMFTPKVLKTSRPHKYIINLILKQQVFIPNTYQG